MALFACDKGIREEAIDAENILGRWRAVEEPDYDWDDSDDDGACDVPMYLGIMTFEHDGREARKSERRAGEINHTATTNKARGIDSSRFIFLPDGIITTARKRSVRNTLPSLLLLREPSTPFAARKFPTP